MTVLCGWLGKEEPAANAQAVVGSMGRALRTHSSQVWVSWSAHGLAVGLLDLPSGEQPQDPSPAVLGEGRYYLWMAGEAFDGGGVIDVPEPEHSRRLQFRCELIDLVQRRGIETIRSVDGEYQIVIWDRKERTLTLVNDRFGALPLYYARTSEGFGFAGGVRGVLLAPGVRLDPDPEALREAVTFGGFRLGDRTNIAGVKMLPGASVLTVRDGSLRSCCYWRWTDIPRQAPRPFPELAEQAHALWKTSVRRRVAGAARPGQTLSGGLDSRAILAEGALVSPTWIALTYGLAGCDDARYAQRAAEAARATWVFYPLYGGQTPDWLDRRTAHIQETDGLIELVDLMHLEPLSLGARLFDTTLSGYIGDAVCGPTFNDVTTPQDVLQYLPFYGTGLGMDFTTALARTEQLVSALDGAPARFALFANKLPQSTNRLTAAWRSRVRVRRPFVDYAFFDFCQGLPSETRGRQAFYERWLLSRYPACFASIPNQKTGVPIQTPRWQLQLDRGRRFLWRKTKPHLGALGVLVRPRLRYYHNDELFWRAPEVWPRIEGTILRPGSLCCETLGRDAVTTFLRDWRERAAGPAQVVGALYVYETYHRDLPDHLSAARKGAIGSEFASSALTSSKLAKS